MPETIKQCVKRRAVLKRKITLSLQQNENDVEEEVLLSLHSIISDHFAQVKLIDEQISDLYCNVDSDELSEEHLHEISNQSDYSFRIVNELTKIKLRTVKKNVDCSNPISHSELKLPNLVCGSFAGEGRNSTEYSSFLIEFNNIIGLRTNLADATKFTYLKTYLKGYALKVINHLHVTDENYQTALSLLEKEFLNKDEIVDDLFVKFFSAKPKFDQTYLETKLYINEIRCIISDLKCNDVDLMMDEACKKMIGHIVFSKLPVAVKRELVVKLNNSFPSLHDIFENYVEVIRTLSLRANDKINNIVANYSDSKVNKSSKRNEEVSNDTADKTDHARTFSKACKFCSSVGHSMFSCRKYNDHVARKNRCNELKLCAFCTSSKHSNDKCPGNLNFKCNICHKNNHIAAMCSGFQTPKGKVNNNCCFFQNDAAGSYILPTITVKFSRGNHTTAVRCLLDTGSQRSYISAGAAERLCISSKDIGSKIVINTFMGSSVKDFLELGMTVQLTPDSEFIPLPILINNEFDLQFDIDGLSNAIANVRKKARLADNEYVFHNGNCVKLEGLIGVDCAQFFRTLCLIKCMNGSAFQCDAGIIPFGNVDHFLTKEQNAAKYSPAFRKGKAVQPDSQVVNSILNPTPGFFDPIGSVIDTDVEGNLDLLFKVESLGLMDDDMSNFDKCQIDKFKNGIQLKDGKYHVSLPWYPDKISNVKPNFDIAKAVLNRVVENLHARNLFKQYDEVLNEQLKDGVLEEFEFDPSDVDNRVWIPHRPVIKTDQQVTTKVRPVLNCSLKVKEACSLNEASYPGVDLLNNLLSLLFMIRTNSTLVVADIRKAFLQIRLSQEIDCNRFCILWKGKSGYRAFRYKTLVFGLAASPFVLNYVIKHHLSQFQDDVTSDILRNNFYVDNLFFTGNDLRVLETICNVAYNRMAAGGFELRSWFSNNKHLREEFQDKNIGTSHNCHAEKVLGYRYFPETDELSTAVVGDDPSDVITKRTVLSKLSRVFDPLGLVLPVTVKGKVLLRKLWESKIGWDNGLDCTLIEEWKNISDDLQKLPEIKFHRHVVDSDEENRLIIFCDASKQAYGFAAYVVSSNLGAGRSKLLFSKVKVAPLKSKTLPTLELMAVFLAFKCLKQILTVNSLSVKEVFIASDSQVALSWILSGCVGTKNIFATNRVKDITQFRQNIFEDYNIQCNFRHVPTDQNPADMITRGMSVATFMSKVDFWNRGPKFLNDADISWPKTAAGCFSESVKTMVNLSLMSENLDPVVPLTRFSSLNKLERVTALVYKFIDKRLQREVGDDLHYRLKSRKYWIHCIQKQHFSNEIAYLLNPQTNQLVPNLINNLNLFVDKECILRAKGRLSKSTAISFDVANPIMLPKDSFFSELVVRDFHERCKHLGVASTLNRLRTCGYWLPKGRMVIKRILSECILCKKINAFPFRYPKRTDFVGDRVNFSRAFEHTGVDYTGHFFIKIGNETRKFYLIVFTCLNIRAVHLELVPSMTSSDFLLSFIKFCNLYGTPASLYSDNASTFSQASKILNESSIDNPLTEYLVKNYIKHVKIPVYSAWVGSAWERLIRVVKNCVYKCIGRKKIEYFQFASLLSDIQNAINSRPLTYRDFDLNNVDVVTPNSFLKPGSTYELVFGNVASSDLQIPNRKSLINTLEKREELITAFKNLWFESYLLSLRETSRDMYESHWEDKIKVGDIVLINSPIKTRAFWPLGRVTELLTGSDAKTRCVRVKRGGSMEEVHSINLLYPLELSTSPGFDDNPANMGKLPTNQNATTRKSTRTAFKVAKKKIENMYN